MDEIVTIVLKTGELLFDFADTVYRRLVSDSDDDE